MVKECDFRPLERFKGGVQTPKNTLPLGAPLDRLNSSERGYLPPTNISVFVL